MSTDSRRGSNGSPASLDRWFLTASGDGEAPVRKDDDSVKLAVRKGGDVRLLPRGDLIQFVSAEGNRPELSAGNASPFGCSRSRPLASFVAWSFAIRQTASVPERLKVSPAAVRYPCRDVEIFTVADQIVDAHRAGQCDQSFRRPRPPIEFCTGTVQRDVCFSPPAIHFRSPESVAACRREIEPLLSRSSRPPLMLEMK